MTPTFRALACAFASVFVPSLLFGQAVPAGIPQITTPPSGGTRSAGVSSTLSVAASGNATLTYQWLRGTSTNPTAEIPGATNASFTLSSPTTADSAYYSVRVSNALGSITTEPVLVAYEQTAGGLARTDLPSNYTASGSQVNAVIPFDDGSFVIGGNFTGVTPVNGSAVTRHGLARFASDGSLDENFPQISSGGFVNAMIRDSSGRILLAGSSLAEISDGTAGQALLTRYGLARILANGTLDTGFNSPVSSASSAFTNAIAEESSGSILVGGTFSNVIGQIGTKYLLRLDGTTGAADATFNPSFSGAIYAIHLLSDGKILVGHNSGLSLLNSDGSAASGFSYGGGTTRVNAIQPLPGGDFLIGRNTSTTPLIRITSTGALVTPFPASGTGVGANQAVTEILALPSGNFILGGNFATYNGSSAVRIAHIAADGTAASGFNFGSGFGSAVNSLALDSSNNLWVGGTFTIYRGASQSKLACLSSSTVAATDPGAPTPDAYTQFLIDAGIAAARRGTADDPDGDGSTNWQEFQNTTNPADATSSAYRLTTAGVGASVTANPSSATGTYPPNSSVELSVTPNSGNSFLGWAPTGTSAADTTNPLTVVMNQERALTAYAGLPIADSLDGPSFTWTTGGSVLWRGVTSPSHDGSDAILATGLTAPGQETWVETNVTGPGVLALRWTLNSSVTNAATLQVLANGSPLQTLAATTGGYQLYAINHSTSGPITLRIRLTANAGISPSDSASIDQFHYGPLVTPVLLPPTNLTATSATLNWEPVSGATQGYDVQVATNATFTGTTQYYWGTPGVTSVAVSPLVSGTLYYYRVKAYGPSASSPYGVGSFTASAQSAQTIDFPQPAAKTFGDPAFELFATASSGLPVSFAVISGPGTISGNSLTLTGGGDIVIRASQAGNGNFLAATPVDRTILVSQNSQSITFSALPNYPADPLSYQFLPATTSSGLPLSFTVDVGSATVVDGMLRVTGTGLVRITASQPGNADFLPATAVTREFTATAAAPLNRMKLTKLGKLPGTTNTATATAISADATTFVGYAGNASNNNEAFRGTTSGITGLGDFAGGSFWSIAQAVSADGSLVVGYGNSALGNEAFFWTSAGLTSLGDLPGGSMSSSANGISADGSVVVGHGYSSVGREAFRWTQATGMTGLGFLAGGSSSTANGISADGQTIVGSSNTASSNSLAFRWTSAAGMVSLGDLPGGQISSSARAASADGSVIVGQSDSALGLQAFRWTAASGMQPLGDLPGGIFQSEATAVSADGTVVVGNAASSNGNVGFVWDETRGMRSLAELLTASGVITSTSVNTANGISADGRFVVGNGWILDLDAPPLPPPTVALLWTENLPAAEPFRVDSVLRMSDENGNGKIDIATHIGSTTGGFNGVEYANGKILVPNQGISGGGTRTHHPDFSSILVTNVFAYDLDEHPGELWDSNGGGQTITRSQRSASPVISGGVYDYSYPTLGSTNVGRFAFAIQKVGSTVYFSNPSNSPVGLYKMNSDGTGITSVLAASDSTAPVIYDFEVVGSFIYFGDIASSSIKRVNTDGSGLTTLVSGVSFPFGIDVTDTAIYWAEMSGGTIVRSDLNGGNVTELVSGLNSPRGVVAAPLSLLPTTDPLELFLADAGVPSNLRGPNDDADGDGLVNLLEYALDLNPAAQGGGNAGFSGSLPVATTAVGQLQFTYRRVRNDLTYTVQTSPSLTSGTWTSVGVDQGIPGGDGTTTASIPLGSGSAFLRLAVSQSPAP